MPKICSADNCLNNVWAKKFCIFHQFLRQDKKKKTIKQFSKKREKENQVYKKLARKFRDENPVCQMNTPICTGVTTCVHHSAGRISKKLLEVKHFIASCFSCNMWVELHDQESREMGLKKSRLN